MRTSAQKTSAQRTFAQSFLTAPDAFPQPGGSPWGDGQLTLEFAGGPYRFAGLSSAQQRTLQRRFAAYLSTGSEQAPVIARLSRLPTSAFRHPPTRGWELQMNLDHCPDHVRAASLRTLVGLTRPRPGAAAGWEGECWTCVADGPEFLGVFENAFRLIVAYRLAELGGVLLHSSGIAHGGGARLFFGHSGAGKTTLARLAETAGHEILSDDMNAVCPAGEELLVEQLPFAGDFGARQRASAPLPLRGLYRLRQSPENRLRPLDRAAGVASLLSCSPFLNHDPYCLETLLANLEDLARRSGLYELEFRRHGGFWGLLAEPLPNSLPGPRPPSHGLRESHP